MTWNLTAIPAAIRIARREGIDAVITTSPPPLRPLRRRRRAKGDRCALDRRLARPARREPAPARRHGRGAGPPGGERSRSRSLVARRADAVTCVSEAIADEVRTLGPRGAVRIDLERLRLRRLRRPRVPAGRSGSGSRTPAASSASATRGRSCRPSGERTSTPSRASSATSARPTANGRRRSGLGDRLELSPTRRAPSRSGCSATPRRCCSSSPMRAAGGRASCPGRSSSTSRPGVRSSRPCRRTALPRSSSARRAAGVVVAPDDVEGMRAALVEPPRQVRERRPAVGRAGSATSTGSRARHASRSWPLLVEEIAVTSHAVPAPARRADPRARARAARDRRALPRRRSSPSRSTRSSGSSPARCPSPTSSPRSSSCSSPGTASSGTTGASRGRRWSRSRSSRLPARLPRRLLQPRHGPGARAVDEGDGEVRPPLRLPRRRSHAARATGAALLLVRARRVLRRHRAERGLRGHPARPRRGRHQPRRDPHRADHVAADRHQRLRRRGRDAEVFRPNALTGDPNHLGIELVIPLLVLTPLYLRMEARTPAEDSARRRSSRSSSSSSSRRSRGAPSSGSRCGALVLALPYRGHLRRPAFLVPLGAVAVLVAAVVVARLDFFLTVLRRGRTRAARPPRRTSRSTSSFRTSSRRTRSSGSASTTSPSTTSSSPAATTSARTRSTSPRSWRRDSWARRSSRVFVVWIFRRLGAARRIGRALSAAGDPLAARVRPLAWGMTAALVATLVANVFYLTMTFYYFYVFAMLAAALPVVFGRRARAREGRRPDDVVPARAGRRRRRLRARRGRAPARRRASRSRSSRPRRSGTSGSRTGTGSRGTCGDGRGRSLLAAALPRSRTRGRRAGPRGTRTSSTRTGFPPRSRRCRHGSRSSSSSGGRTPSSRGARRWAARTLVAAGPRRRLPLRGARRRRARARRARGTRRPERRRDPGVGRRAGRAAARPLRRPPLGGEGRPGASSPRRKGCRVSSSATGRSASACPTRAASSRRGELGAYYERAAVVVCPSHREGYGVVAREAMALRPPGRRERGRRSPGRSRGRRHRAPRPGS